MKKSVPLHFSSLLKNLLQLTAQTGALVMLLLLFLSSKALAEGSVDFRNYPGYRLFYWANEQQQMKVYAKAGEFINVGASHVGVNGGAVVVFKPDGTLANVFDDTGANAGLGIINNDVEELNGPTGGGTTMGTGYNPGVVEVQPGEEGIWTVLISFPTPSTAVSVPFTNLLNSDTWDKNTSQIDEWCVVAWDVTVSTGNAGNDGGSLLEGRVFTNQYKSIIFLNGNTTSPTFYILASDGFQYQVDFNETDPYGFELFANSTGLVNFQQQPAYKSLANEDYTMSGAPASWTPGSFYLWDPQEQDFGAMVTQKIFFNIPNSDMPTSAPTTNIYTGQTYTTWLYNEPSTNTLDVTGLSFTALDDFGGNDCFGANMTPGFGGDLTFNTTVGGTVKFSLDLNSDGDYDDAEDRVIFGNAIVGSNTLYWDGLDGTGANLAFTSNMQINYKVEMNGGEIHIMFLDVENNTGGITFERMNGPAAPDNGFFYDHTSIGGTASGGAAPNLTSTTVPYTYDSGFGNNNLLDYWAYADLAGSATGSFIVDVVASCTTPSLRDSDNDGIVDNEDLDDDNDGIPDAMEFCHPNNDWSCLPNGVDPSGDNDNDGVPNYIDSNDASVANGCSDTNGNGVCNTISPIYDKDLDGVPDHLDLDSDNDGILDMTEAGHGLPDTDLDGRIDGTPSDFGDNGLFNPIATDPDDYDATIIYGVLDTDSNGIPDHDDLDSDDDGILDAIEAPGSDSDFDGIIGTGVPVVDLNGIPIMDGNGNPISIAHAPLDFDMDGLPDYRDWDRDNDGIPDYYECTDQTNCEDSDNDGIPDVDELDSDGDGIADADECASGTPCTDSDNNGVDDFREVATLLCGTGNTPVISGLVGAGTYCIGNDVVLSASNSTTMSGVMVDYTWTGPNGFSYTATTGSNGPFSFTLTNVTANETGTYELTLMTDQGCGSNPQNVQVTVGNTAIAAPSIASNDDVLCEGQMLELTTAAATGTNVSYEWFFDNGVDPLFTLGQTTTPTYVINNANTASTGTYSMIVSVDGCTSQPSNPINVTVYSTSAPVATNTTVQSSPICEGESVQLSVPLVQDATYEWFGPNGSFATTHDPVINNITATDAGSYYVEVVMSDGCATLVSTNTTVYVQAAPAPATIPAIAPVCEGSDLTMTANTIGIPPSTNVSYEWYSVQSSTSIGTTTTPSFTFNNIAATSAGDYYVVMTVGGCIAPASDIQNVQVVPTSEMPNAGMDMSECGLGNIMLSATTPTVGTGVWTSPTGAVVLNANDPQAEAFGLNDGTNVLVWSLSNGICENYASDTVIVNYNLLTDLAAAGDDVKVCDATTATLNALAPSSAFGVWSQPANQGAMISNNTSVTPTVSGLVPGNTYTFTYSLSQGACLNYDSDVVEVIVSELPATLAHITEDRKYTCGDDETTLNAIAPDLGEGKWTTTSNASIVTSNNASTIVTDIPMGTSMYVWNLSNGACENYDADSIMVYREDAIEVTDDNFSVNLNERIEGGDVMINDFVGNVNDWEITIVEEPTLGEIEMTDGIFNYVPYQNAFGTEEIVYEICNRNCPDDCQRGTITIELNGLTETGDCWIPNVVTPNGNGKNDVLLIPCADQFPDNELKVFNRWGDKVYSTNNYQNDWAATYKGKTLPAGTYYYMFKQSRESNPRQGFFEVIR